MKNDEYTAKILDKIKRNKIIAVLIVLGIIVVSLGNFTDAINKVIKFVDLIRKSSEQKNVELFEIIEKYSINANVRKGLSTGDIVLTPLGLFKNPKAKSNREFLLCRFTNTSDRKKTMAALTRKDHRTGGVEWCALVDLKLGYTPVINVLMMDQGLWGGKLLRHNPHYKEIVARRATHPKALSRASLESGETKYGYIASRDKDGRWPHRTTFEVIDVADKVIGETSIFIIYE